MKIWQCYTGLLQQNWSVGFNGGLFRLSNNQCLDVRLESGAGGGPIIFRDKSMQTWTCSSGDPQQRESLADLLRRGRGVQLTQLTNSEFRVNSV
jgi:hypothetical protein